MFCIVHIEGKGENPSCRVEHQPGARESSPQHESPRMPIRDSPESSPFGEWISLVGRMIPSGDANSNTGQRYEVIPRYSMVKHPPGSNVSFLRCKHASVHRQSPLRAWSTSHVEQNSMSALPKTHRFLLLPRWLNNITSLAMVCITHQIEPPKRPSWDRCWAPLLKADKRWPESRCRILFVSPQTKGVYCSRSSGTGRQKNTQG